MYLAYYTVLYYTGYYILQFCITDGTVHCYVGGIVRVYNIRLLNITFSFIFSMGCVGDRMYWITELGCDQLFCQNYLWCHSNSSIVFCLDSSAQPSFFFFFLQGVKGVGTWTGRVGTWMWRVGTWIGWAKRVVLAGGQVNRPRIRDGEWTVH